MSLFELPPARGPRVFRIVMILLLDVILAGSGIAMVMSYINGRDSRAAVVAGDKDSSPAFSADAGAEPE